MKLKQYQVDAFATRAFEGNQPPCALWKAGWTIVYGKYFIAWECGADFSADTIEAHLKFRQECRTMPLTRQRGKRQWREASRVRGKTDCWCMNEK